MVCSFTTKDFWGYLDMACKSQLRDCLKALPRIVSFGKPSVAWEDRKCGPWGCCHLPVLEISPSRAGDLVNLIEYKYLEEINLFRSCVNVLNVSSK